MPCPVSTIPQAILMRPIQIAYPDHPGLPRAVEY
jgi:hypothetical protein